MLNVMLGVLDFGMPLEEAMVGRRVHHQWLPDEVYFDGEGSDEIWMGLIRRGHRISKRKKGGVVQALVRLSDGWVGASDPRKGGKPAGY